MPKTRKNLPWSGWSKIKPTTAERTTMLRNCGKKCFLGPNKTFPICIKNTCKKSRKGVYAAYVRAREYTTIESKTVKGNRKYKKIANKAYRMLNK